MCTKYPYPPSTDSTSPLLYSIVKHELRCSLYTNSKYIKPYDHALPKDANNSSTITSVDPLQVLDEITVCLLSKAHAQALTK